MNPFDMVMGVGLLFVGLYYLTEILSYADEFQWNLDFPDWVGVVTLTAVGLLSAAIGLTLVARELLKMVP